MNMNFNRLRVQQSMEKCVGCNDIEKWGSYRTSLENYNLSKSDESALRYELSLDAEDIYFKGILSICEALNGISNGLHSWAIVKLYYSVFYFLRCSLALNGYAIIKNKSLYLLKIEEGAIPLKKSAPSYRNDHIGIINVYKNVIGLRDILQTNTINGECVYLWLSEKRHQIHYRQRSFDEPNYCNFLQTFNDIHNILDIEKNIIEYINDSIPIYCFDENHACLAMPIKKAVLTKNELKKYGLFFNSYEQSKVDVLKRLLSPYSSDVVNLLLN
jgi:hypothetical protein